MNFVIFVLQNGLKAKKTVLSVDKKLILLLNKIIQEYVWINNMSKNEILKNRNMERKVKMKIGAIFV